MRTTQPQRLSLARLPTGERLEKTPVPMNYVLIIAFAVFVALVTTPSAVAQGAGYEWANLNRQAIALHQAGKYDLAEAIAKKALGLAERNVGPSHSDVATSLESLAAVYRSTGRNDEAESLEERAADIRAIQR